MWLLIGGLFLPPGIGTVSGAETQHDPGECWWPRLAIVLSVHGGTAKSDVDFTSAVKFLEANTGIGSELELTFVGFVVDKRILRKSLGRWVTWYIDHYPYLYWEQQQRLFLVDRDAERERRPTRLLRLPADGNCDPPKLDGAGGLFGTKPDE